MNIQELLQSPEFKEALEQELAEALKEKSEALEEAKKDLEAQKRLVEREAFIARKALVRKFDLFETKLKEHYDKQYATFVRTLSENVFTTVNTKLEQTISAVATDAKANTKAGQMQEAFNAAFRALAPFMDLSEAVAVADSQVDKLKSQLNDALLANKSIKSELASKDVALVVATECAKLSTEDRAVVTEGLRAAAPKTVDEAKAAIKGLVEALDKRKADAILESVTALLPTPDAKPLAESVVAEPRKPKVSVSYDPFSALTR